MTFCWLRLESLKTYRLGTPIRWDGTGEEVADSRNHEIDRGDTRKRRYHRTWCHSIYLFCYVGI